MANPISSAVRSFWHSMTSYDRHSSYDSPYRSGRHVPLDGARSGTTTVATADAAFADDHGRASMSALSAPAPYLGSGASMSAPTSPNPARPYSPGVRSLNAQRANTSMSDGFELQSPSGEIPMQAFDGGMAPPPPVEHSWGRIDRWAEEHYPELYDQLCQGCTNNDINELEHQLDCSLPDDVRASLRAHDGQERGGNPTGIIFGSMLLDCEEMVHEWEQWRKVNQQFLLDRPVVSNPSMPDKALVGSRPSPNNSQASSSRPTPPPISTRNPSWRQDLMARQDSVPPNAVQKAYAHPAWIPLVRDWGGNNLAVDLAPGPAGSWGQVILFGRDYDTKYVVARSWAAFIAVVADDLGSGKWFVEEETHELKLREFKKSRVEPAYFDILRWRMDQKYRRGPRRRSGLPPGAVSPAGSASPYASPTTEAPDPRGRSMQRLSGHSPVASPSRMSYGKPSPLGRVTEESPLSLPLRPKAAADHGMVSNGPPALATSRTTDILVQVETPRPSAESRFTAEPRRNTDTAAAREPRVLEKTTANVQLAAVEDALKTIEI